MAELKIIVPDGNGCERCPYSKKESKEVGYQQWSETKRCLIFNADVSYGKKCDECYLRTVQNNGKNH